MASEEQAQPQPEGLLDAPNQQVVRGDGSGPGIEWGEPAAVSEATGAPETAGGQSLDEMTKAELLEYAKSLEVSPANNDMTKEELRAGVDAKLAEGGGTG